MYINKPRKVGNQYKQWGFNKSMLIKKQYANC